MKGIVSLVILAICHTTLFSQDMTRFKLYHPEENAEAEIAKAVKKAREEGKHVLIHVGGNWCVWCARFNDFVSSDPRMDSVIDAAYVVYHMNFSKENNNAKLLTKYGYPQRFGFPVFLILDKEGKLIHTQNSSYLEDGKNSYDKEKVLSFLMDWAPSALDPKLYKEK